MAARTPSSAKSVWAARAVLAGTLGGVAIVPIAMNAWGANPFGPPKLLALSLSALLIVTGAAIGLLQDALTHQPIGLYGISKTVVGFVASSLGIKIDVENAGARLLLTMAFYVIHEIVYFMIARGLVSLHMEWSWGRELWSGLANAFLGVLVYALMDRVKQRT